MEISLKTKAIAANFEKWGLDIQREFSKEKERIQGIVSKRDREANLLYELIKKYPKYMIDEVMDIIKADKLQRIDQEAKNQL